MKKTPFLALLAALPLPALADVPRVVTDLPVVQSLAAQVMGDLGRPEVLLEQGGNAHSYQLKPSQAAALQSADLVIWVGPEMTPWLDRALDAVTGAGAQLALLHTPGTHLQDFGGAPHAEHDDDAAEAHDHDEHAEGDEEHDHEEEGEEHHHHTGLDPHAWLAPGNAEVWLGQIAAALSEVDPEHAATYAANAKAAQASVAALDAKLRAELAPVAGRPFVVFHAAYGYLAAQYGLSVAGAVNLGDATSPGAAHLAELRADLAQQGVVCAFPEAQHDPKQIEILLEGTQVKLGGALDPSGSALSFGPGLYSDLMQGLADALSACLQP
ncbi:zinc ABC transporter substrate-binding protein [Rhodobacter maris]|uniref:High-affinity zinc uptake system protein ZnuA n=1 Tax=Rhodobacter maris TaxID=446682 RepID=A0A285RFR1_9RHOB|nr:zinc ABC transporter substrate-binding protein [Rhodobacter maris]SOB92568.1 zinc transport system substrate-binding protein [Rhodobacter maris]